MEGGAVNLQMRLKCLGCGHSEALSVSPLVPPEEWMRCPKCGPLDHVRGPGSGRQKRAQQRNVAKGGVTVRGVPRRTH